MACTKRIHRGFVALECCFRTEWERRHGCKIGHTRLAEAEVIDSHLELHPLQQSRTIDEELNGVRAFGPTQHGEVHLHAVLTWT